MTERAEKKIEKRTAPAFQRSIAAAIILFALLAADCGKSADSPRAPAPASPVVAEYTTYSYDAADNLIHKVSYLTTGAETSRGAAQGEVTSYFKSMYDTSGRLTRLIRYDGAGPDGEWIAGDDRIDNYTVTDYDASGTKIRETVYDGPGVDGVWFTQDDDVDSSTSFSHEASGSLQGKITFIDPGHDNVWFTPDDAIASYTVYSYDARGSVSRETRSFNPGPDAQWFTDDDLISYSTAFDYDAGGHLVSEFRYDQPDSDGSWSSMHARPGAVIRYAYNDAGRQIAKVQYYGPGEDNIWFSADDAVLRIVITTYDDSGIKMREEEFDDPGPDGRWSTADDRAGYFTTFEYNSDATLSRRTRYCCAGSGVRESGLTQPAIGVFYFPGWSSTYNAWNDIQGLPGSYSPGIPWPDRTPLLGYYLEDETRVAEKHIAWASRYGITFFAYDWYWDGVKPLLDTALQSHLRARNRDKLPFALLWANHSETPATLQEFDAMVSYWIANYFTQPDYYTIEDAPAVFIFSNEMLDYNARKFGETVQSLLNRAEHAAVNAGYRGIYFILTTNAMPGNGVGALREAGYDAYTGWNYVISRDASVIADYTSMVDTYLAGYDAAAAADEELPYIAAASPGWDARPWLGSNPFVYVREHSTPEKFEKMLMGARAFLRGRKSGPNILMIEAWNEFGEGSYLEPTRKWDMLYLDALSRVFHPAAK